MIDSWLVKAGSNRKPEERLMLMRFSLGFIRGVFL
jgi:hypothetical protein